MKLKYIIYFFILFPCLICCQTFEKVAKYNQYVGDIKFDENLDDPYFKICNPEDTYQYFNGLKGFEYQGEKSAIEERLRELNIRGSKNTNGYIIIRFLINCEGKPGLFRMMQMNLDYKEKEIDSLLGIQLLKFTKLLDGWSVKRINNREIDYYQYLTYKIKDGQIIEILP
ncbi:hypothetical protein [Chryseobacterium fistulae]|uniref:Uncharacterized protein n=1 Tax=Chryseobacterium fistulae TaxID=2675058 RepID=A0A6N4XJI2_9FLAO|nr:hypothetical protein [Chryseobacterium fistulae]CAA7385897.1 hypothetical protein CHRY9393_00185 [Chryseobacterium fistulae]